MGLSSLEWEVDSEVEIGFGSLEEVALVFTGGKGDVDRAGRLTGRGFVRGDGFEAE